MRKLLLSLAVLSSLAVPTGGPVSAMPTGASTLAAILNEGATAQTVQYGGMTRREFRERQEFRRRQALRRQEFRRRQAARRGYYRR